MSIYQKLQKIRCELQKKSLKKSGWNPYSEFAYFEMGDFLPTVNELFLEVGFCGIVTFTADIASLTIHDTEDKSTITITSPMGSAKLKACHEVQNIGAVETYQRRYLYMTALEIVESDPLDATVGDKSKPTVETVPKAVEPKTQDNGKFVEAMLEMEKKLGVDVFKDVLAMERVTNVVDIKDRAAQTKLYNAMKAAA